jgi:hypothetical protein
MGSWPCIRTIGWGPVLSTVGTGPPSYTKARVSLGLSSRLAREGGSSCGELAPSVYSLRG